MADLTELQASQSIKIAGADSSGVETNFVNATSNGELKAADFLNVSITQSTLVVNGTGSPVEVKVGASRLANRKSVMIQAQGTNVIYGFSAASQPFTLANGSTITISIGDSVGVWIFRSSNGNVNVPVAEFA